MRAAKYASAAIVLLLASTQGGPAAARELKRFAVQDAGCHTTYMGLAEPYDPSGKSRIFVYPRTELGRGEHHRTDEGVWFSQDLHMGLNQPEDDIGRALILLKVAPPSMPVGHRVTEMATSVQRSCPPDLGGEPEPTGSRQGVAAFPDQRPTRLSGRDSAPNCNDELRGRKPQNAEEAQRQAQLSFECGAVDQNRVDAYGVVGDAMRHYEVEPVFPSRLDLTVISAGKRYPAGSIASAGTVGTDGPLLIDLSLPATLYPLLKRGRYTVEVRYAFPAARIASVRGIGNISAVATRATERVVEDLRRISQSSTGFLFFEETQSHVRNDIHEAVRVNQQSVVGSQVALRIDDGADEKIMALLEKQLFPAIDLRELIANHERAGRQASGALARAHEAYAAALKAGDPGRANVNAAKALQGLAKGDYLTFLTEGFAFRNSQASGRFTYRKVVNETSSETVRTRFDAIMAESVVLEHVDLLSPDRSRIVVEEG